MIQSFPDGTGQKARAADSLAPRPGPERPGHRGDGHAPQDQAQQGDQGHIETQAALQAGHAPQEQGRRRYAAEQPVRRPGGQTGSVPGAAQQVVYEAQSRPQQQEPPRLLKLYQRRKGHYFSSRDQNPPRPWTSSYSRLVTCPEIFSSPEVFSSLSTFSAEPRT